MEKNLVKITINENLFFNIFLPNWFILERGENGVTFEEQINKNGFITLPTVYKKIYNFLKDKKNIILIDIGSNLGLSTLPLSLNNNEVISIEPLKSNYDLLSESKKINNLNFKLLKYAIGENEGVDKIYSGGQTDCASMVLESVTLIEECKSYEEVEVKRLDNIIFEDNLFIKIDVQGFEMSVLKSMNKLLDQNKVKFILIEMENRFLIKGGSSVYEVHTFLTDRGFVYNNFYGDDVLYSKI